MSTLQEKLDQYAADNPMGFPPLPNRNIETPVSPPSMEEQVAEVMPPPNPFPDMPDNKEDFTPEQELFSKSSKDALMAITAQQRKKPVRKREPISVDSITEEFSLNDLEDEDHYLYDEWNNRTNRFLEGLGTLKQGASVRKTKDIYEYLRDEKYSTTRTITRAMQNKQWTPEMTEDYRFIRQIFDKAKLGGTRQILEATKDIGIDLIADPMNLVTAAVSMFTGGLGGAAVQAGVRGVAAVAGKQALAQTVRNKAAQMGVAAASPTGANVLKGMSIGITEGALDGSLINAATQISELQTGLRREGDRFSVAELGVSTGLGAMFGGTLGAGVSRVGNAIARRSHAKAMGNADASFPDQVLDEVNGELRATTASDIARFRNASRRFNKGVSRIFGKSTTEFIDAGAESPALKKLLETIRYDSYKSILKPDQIDNLAIPSYNIRKDMRQGKLRTLADKFITSLDSEGSGGILGKHNFLNIKTDAVQNNQLLGLLVDSSSNYNLEALYRKYYNVPDFIKKKANKSMDGTLKKNWERQGILKIGGEDVSPEVIGAAFHIRRTFNDAHRQASNIPLLQADGSFKGHTSLFNLGSDILENYLPRVWKYEKLKEQKDKLIKLLVPTSHTKLYDGEFPTVKGRLAGADEELELKLIDGKLVDAKTSGKEVAIPMIEDLDIKITGSKIDEKLGSDEANWTKAKNAELEFILTNQGDKDQKYFEKYFAAQTADIGIKGIKIESFRDLARHQLKDTGSKPEEIELAARTLKATALVDEMINKKHSLHMGFDKRSLPSRTSYTQLRTFNELNDMDLINLGVIEGDVKTLFSDYMHKISSSIERTSLFGNNLQEFDARWGTPIERELKEAQKTNPALTNDIINNVIGVTNPYGETEGIRKLYTHVTGLEHAHIKNKYVAGVLDATKISMRLAYLPLSTLSSITEPMIALSRADFADTPAFYSAFANAGGKAWNRQWDKIFRASKVGLTGKKVKGLKDLSDEDWMEFNQSGLMLEQALEDRMQGLYGEASTEWGRKVTETFFQFNLLAPWTQAVQMGAYNFSNARITRILGDLDRGANFMNKPLSKAETIRRVSELRQIGVPHEQGLAAYRKVKNNNNGVFSEEQWKASDFYDHSVVPSSSLFAREIILNPSVAEANTPLWFSNPALQLFVQFMGYPTAFNNVVLKGMIKGMKENPKVNMPKVLAATTLMTGTALLTNTLRSHGENLNPPDGRRPEPLQILTDSVSRWGGLGPIEYLIRYREGVKYGGQGAVPVVKAWTGPLPGKLMDLLQYQQTFGEFFGTAIPGYAALSPNQRRRLRRYLRQRTTRDSIYDRTHVRRPVIKQDLTRLGAFATGGVVNVANAPSEPDERIDRMTGLPYNMQAGEAYIDKEDRLGFAEGDLVEQEDEEEIRELSDKEKARFKVQENEMYKLLTRDEGEYATLDQSEIEVSSPESLEDLEISETFYTALPENSIKAKLEAYRDSKTLGLVVSESPAEGNVRLKGRINFRNVLRLNVDEVTPATVEDKMSVVKAGNVLTKPYLADAIIDSMQYHLGVRDKVLEMDDELTKDKEDVLEQSKSFILRHGLLKLGYDAIKYNNGYVLLRENQFMPTEIMGSPSGLGRDARNRGGLMGSLKKQRASYDKGGAALFGKFGGTLLSVLKGNLLEGQSEGEALYNTLAPRSTLPVVPNTSVRRGALHYNRKGITLPGAGDKGKGKGSLSAHFDPKNESVGLQFSQPFATGGKVEADEDANSASLLSRLRENVFNRLKIKDRETARKSLDSFNKYVVMAESSNRYDATTGIEGNTASGGYQITDDQAITASNRILNSLARMEGMYNKDNKGAERKEYMEKGNVPQWLREVSLGEKKVLQTSPTQQQILFEGNMFEAKGSDEVITPLFSGDRSAMDTYYYNFHHTDPEGQPNTKENWRRAVEHVDSNAPLP